MMIVYIHICSAVLRNVSLIQEPQKQNNIFYLQCVYVCVGEGWRLGGLFVVI